MFKKFSMILAVLSFSMAFFVLSACDDGAKKYDLGVNITWNSDVGSVDAWGVLIKESSGKDCDTFEASDIAYWATTELTTGKKSITQEVTGSMTIKNVAKGDYVACMFIDVDGQTGGEATTSDNARPESGDYGTDPGSVTVTKDENFDFTDIDFDLIGPA